MGKHGLALSEDRNSIESSSNYNRVSFGLCPGGIQKTFLPEIKFEFSDINYSDDAEVASNINVQAKTETKRVEVNNQDGSAFIFSLGGWLPFLLSFLINNLRTHNDYIGFETTTCQNTWSISLSH